MDLSGLKQAPHLLTTKQRSILQALELNHRIPGWIFFFQKLPDERAEYS
jgi:hypothetical protein